jgi:Suppressor of fused protein (SUFU)
MAGEEVLVAVEAHLAAIYGSAAGNEPADGATGEDIARASVSFLGVERIDVLRFGGTGGQVRYATVGMSRRPMSDGATSTDAAPAGAIPTDAAPADAVHTDDSPRAELVLTLRRPRDSVLRRLAVLAATPAVEGLVLAPDGTVELGEPLWDGARCTAVLIEPPADPPATTDRASVQLLPVTPITAEELAYRRVHGADALRQAWRAEGTDLADPDRPPVRLR